MSARPRRAPHLIVLAVVLGAAVAGCGGTADEPTVSATATASPEAASPDAASPEAPSPEATTPAAEESAPGAGAPDGATVVEVSIAGGSVTTAAGRVDVAVGTPVRLVVTSDVADELHVHGVDVETPLAAGQPAVLDFVPAEPGLYDVETHESGLMLVQIAAR